MSVLIPALELAAFAIVVYLATRPPVAEWRGWTHGFRAVSRLGRRHRLCLLASAVLACGIGIIFSALRPPVPAVHDEFSYLLAADTFAQGRLANPTHPMWIHLESIHILHQPTYASKYPPGQGLLLALGQLGGGHPLVGVWLGTALAVAATCWMLQAWVPGRWALVGSLLVALHPVVQFMWGQSYWGGSLALAGGALLLGAWRRLVRSPSVLSALIMALGVAILANTRPFEGCVLALPVAAALVVWLVGPQRPGWAAAIFRVILPALVVLGITAAGMLYYNQQVTGAPLKPPYQVHEQQYATAQPFVWQSPRPSPSYRHAVLQRFHQLWTRAKTGEPLGTATLLEMKAHQAVKYWQFFLGTTLTIPLVIFLRRVRRREMVFVVVLYLFSLAASATVVWWHPHYSAPALPLLILILVQGLRYLRTLGWQKVRCGRGMVAGLMIVYCSLFLLRFLLNAAASPADWAAHRARIVQRLEQTGEKHLVVVRYDRSHNVHNEWVYNAATIDDAPVVWARNMDAEQNRRLVEHFKDRRMWLLLADEQPPQLIEHK